MTTVAYEIEYQFSPAEIARYTELASRVQGDPTMSVLQLNLACMERDIDWERFVEWWVRTHKKKSDAINQ